MLKFWSGLLLTLLLAGCSTASYRGNHPSANHVSAVINSTDDSATIHSQQINPCAKYDAPRIRPVPKVPVFTPEEQTNTDALNVRLVKYIDELRAYIAISEHDHAVAYRRYLASCKDK